MDQPSLPLPMPSGVRLPVPESPPFLELLQEPIVREKLPPDFSAEEEAAHLTSLWTTIPGLQQYSFLAFVHAGGSGMVFKARQKGTNAILALKIARLKVMPGDKTNTTLSPVSSQELLALKILSHPNVVHLEDAIGFGDHVFAIATTYVDSPAPIDSYLREILSRRPPGTSAFAPERIENACVFLWNRFLEIAAALQHMHARGVYHFDIKPANVLVSGRDRTASLTDLGASVHRADLERRGKIRVQFTWTYAHPNLTSLVARPRGITGGGLKSSAEIDVDDFLARFDLFAFGRTVQECLAILTDEFGDRCYATYGFRYLWLLGCLLLDGHNAPSRERTCIRDGQRFVSDSALNYPVRLFDFKKITSADLLLTKLQRFRRDFSWNAEVPELDPAQPNLINTGTGGFSPFTKRVAAVFSHPAMQRLREETQLGWIREVYPGATHDRWTHSLGVFAATCQYINALLADPEVPTFRLLVERADIEHILIAAAIHDIGQTAFGHDFEAANNIMYNHENITARLLTESLWTPTLANVISSEWPTIDLTRVVRILKGSGPTNEFDHDPVDGLATDIINGPIDADKYDYIWRDAIACGVSYGKGVDRERFLQALTVDVKEINARPRLALAYRAKNNAAIQSLLLARYQLYEAIYWHHTFRCIQAMLVHVVAETFKDMKVGGRFKSGDKEIASSTVIQLFYHWVVCKQPWHALRGLEKRNLPSGFYDDPPVAIAREPALCFVWRFSSEPNRRILQRLAERKLFKRIFEIRVGDLGETVDYPTLRPVFEPTARLGAASRLRDSLLNAIATEMAQRGPRETVGEHEARERYQELVDRDLTMVIIDFPTRGVPDERNFPREMGDPARKYIPEATARARSQSSVFHVVKRLQSQMATVRVFVAPELHSLVVRYLSPDLVRACVESAIGELATRG